DVVKRVKTILRGGLARELSAHKKLTLAFAAIAAIAVPVGLGLWTAPVIRAQVAPANTPKFDVASIRSCKDPSQSPPRGHIPGSTSSPGRLNTDCVSVLHLIADAYLEYGEQSTGGPPWLRSFYEIQATAEGKPSVRTMLGPMLQALLEDRFKLKV